MPLYMLIVNVGNCGVINFKILLLVLILYTVLALKRRHHHLTHPVAECKYQRIRQRAKNDHRKITVYLWGYTNSLKRLLLTNWMQFEFTKLSSIVIPFESLWVLEWRTGLADHRFSSYSVCLFVYIPFILIILKTHLIHACTQFAHELGKHS